MAITLGVDLGLFGAMLENKSSPKSVAELGKMLSVDPGLLGLYSAMPIRPRKKLTRYQPVL
jgi:hypothetical protein